MPHKRRIRKMSHVQQHQHFAVVVNELAHIWNHYTWYAQFAFMLCLAEEKEGSPSPGGGGFYAYQA